MKMQLFHTECRRTDRYDEANMLTNNRKKKQQQQKQQK
jgi:hypothetical protein